MNRIFGKRILREVKENFLRWFALFLMIVMGMYIVVAVVGAAENIIEGSNKAAEKNLVESGEFKTFLPLTQMQEKLLCDMEIELEQEFFVDITQGDGRVLRLMKNREKINLIALDRGRQADKMGEIVLEKRYCEENGLAVGDKIEIAAVHFIIVGIGTTPDYDLPTKNFSDMSAENTFGTAFVTGEQYAEILADFPEYENYIYAYRLLEGATDGQVKQAVKDLGAENLMMFITAAENPRILAAAGDMVLNREVGLLAGVVVMILFAYVISVFVIHQIKCESSVIGTLYALGVKDKELLIHYITLPTMITFFGGLIGAVLGFSEWGITGQMASTYSYFSIPIFDRVYPFYLIIYALIIPPLISVIVNFAVIRKFLSKTALALMQNCGNSSKFCNVKLRNNDFIRDFQLRQILRETRTGIAMTGGMFISLLIFMLGLNCFVLCWHIKADSAKSVKFEYMYSLNSPPQSILTEGEACYAKPLSKTEFGYTLEISVIGIGDNNKYFEAKPGKKSLVIGSAAATKYRLEIGDKFVLTDRAKEMDYEFIVEGICDYSAGLSVFMNIDSMRELFGKEDGYYNMILSDEALDLGENVSYSVISRADIEHSSAVFVDLMMPMVIMMTTISVIVFFVVIYLMLGVMIDRSGFGISLVKIFGFKQREIRRLYLDGNTMFIAFGALICIPLAKTLMDAVYPRIVANVACGLNLHFEWYFYIMIFAGIMLIYFAANSQLIRKINKITPAVVLKYRE